MGDESFHAYRDQRTLAADQQRLCQRLLGYLKDMHPLVSADVVRALQAPGKLLYQPLEQEQDRLVGGRWALLPFSIARIVSPAIDQDYAATVAVAVECFICALDLLDDVEDEDRSETVNYLGIPRTLNVSSVLLALSQRIIQSVAVQGATPLITLRLCTVLQEALSVATEGQHLDLLAEERGIAEFSYEECMEIVSKKSSALMKAACLAGAVCAGADEAVCEQFALLGQLTGIASQLDNDSHDLYDLLQDESEMMVTSQHLSVRSKSSKTDLIRGKKTLPIVLAANMNDDVSLMTDELFQHGWNPALKKGILSVRGIALLYRERANECLQEIETCYPTSSSLRFLMGLMS